MGITGAFRVSGKNDNGRRVVGFCGERGCVRVMYTSSTRVSINTSRVIGAKTDGGKMYDISYIGKERYPASCPSDLFVVMCRVRLVGVRIKRREVVWRLKGL